MSNELEIMDAELHIANSPAYYPENSRALLSKSGAERGRQYSFTGVQTAKELRESLKAKGVKGSELTKQVNDVLRGNSTLSTQLALAFIVQEAKRGIVYTTGDALKGSSVLRGKIVKEEPVKQAKDKPAPSIDDVLATMTEEQATEAIAKIAAKFGS